MGAARKYPDELGDRAVRLVLDLVKDQDASVTAACRKVGGELGIKADTLRGWAKQAQIDRALRQAGVAISPSGYYAARARAPSARAVRDAALEKQILRVCKAGGERYGAWKVRDQLNREGIAAARCTVERLMRRLGLRGV